MSKVTSKLQVTVPKLVAEHLGIRPGDQIDWVESAGTVRIVPSRRRAQSGGTAERLRLFDAATKRQAVRQRSHTPTRPPRDRGWTREELYRRGDAR